MCSPVLREVLTDSLVELRDSISRQLNNTVVPVTLTAVDRWLFKCFWWKVSEAKVVEFEEKNKGHERLYWEIDIDLGKWVTKTKQRKRRLCVNRRE